VFQTKMLDMLKQTGRCVCGCGRPPSNRTPFLSFGLPFPPTMGVLTRLRRVLRDCDVDRRWWLGGTTATRGSGAGCLAWT